MGRTRRTHFRPRGRDTPAASPHFAVCLLVILRQSLEGGGAEHDAKRAFAASKHNPEKPSAGKDCYCVPHPQLLSCLHQTRLVLPHLRLQASTWQGPRSPLRESPVRSRVSPQHQPTRAEQLRSKEKGQRTWESSSSKTLRERNQDAEDSTRRSRDCCGP